MGDCEKIALHGQYIDYKEFSEKSERYKAKFDNCFKPTVLEPDDYKELHSFLKKMSSLTGILLISSGAKEKWFGTGFVVKLRRQQDSECPCSDHIDNTSRNMEYAIVTISTAYHVFNEEDGEVKRYSEVDEIWDKYKTVFKPHYNDASDDIEDLKTLYGYRLVEMDKDLDFDCDWCAIECVTHDPELITSLESTISDYQKGLAQLYKTSQKDMYKGVNLVVIIGHPHRWAKRISIGQTCHFKTSPIKTILKEVRSRQSWCRYSYSNLTCAGSSGSPIFIWGQPITGFGYWFGHPHNHSEGPDQTDSDNDEVVVDDSDKEKVYYGISTIGVENI